MCGLFGFLHYGRNKIKNLSYITNVLAEEAAVRGTDATGIAYNLKGKLCIDKNSKSAYDMTFKHSNNITALIGHTRHSTQGDKKYNYNNHPFYGSCGNTKFALAHNGVLINDKDLKQEYKLPKTKIETDSYVAVQLLEYKDKLNFDNLKFMAENVEGSFSFSVLDNGNTLYLIKGDSPLNILHFPKEKIYIYASTEEILWKALIETDLFLDIKENNYEQVKISDGDILRISPQGKLDYNKFNFIDYSGNKYCKWWNYGYDSYIAKSDKDYSDVYIEDLKCIAAYQGYSPDDIDTMLESGISPDEIEEYLYCWE